MNDAAMSDFAEGVLEERAGGDHFVGQTGQTCEKGTLLRPCCVFPRPKHIKIRWQTKHTLQSLNGAK